MNKKKACIIVLGDIGRSPRMQYHALSLLEENYKIELIGYNETPILESLKSSNSVNVIGLSKFPDINLPSSLKYLFKCIWQTLTLLIALISIAKPNFILVQNPPGVPTLFVVWLYCIFARTHFIVDWHNYTYTILSIGSQQKKKNFIVSMAKWIERKFGSKASANFCVTKAMKEDLKKHFGIKANVLYDRPPPQFKPINLEEKHEFFMKLSKIYPEFMEKDGRDFHEFGVKESTALTQKFIDGAVRYKTERPAIIVSSTSWTPDEDFDVLLQALQEYENSTKQSNAFPELLCIITGKGPQKEYYLNKISKISFTKVSIVTPWLESEDYPKVLAAADLGICLHWSSSGLDLPMKVVDMFGCGLPVCAINFNCLHELVIDGENGFIFENSKELADQLKMWFEKFPNNFSLINTMEIFTKNLKEFQSLRWKENWKLNALPVLTSLSLE